MRQAAARGAASPAAALQARRQALSPGRRRPRRRPADAQRAGSAISPQAAQREHFARAVDGDGTCRRNEHRVPSARPAECGQAIAEAAAAFPAWRDRQPLERSQILVRAAASMRDDRDELAALMIREAGKPWREADADVCEAIDFCEFYAR